MPRHRNTFTSNLFELSAGHRRQGRAANVSPRKVFRLAIVLMMSFLCWIGVGCFAFEVVQLAAR